MGQKAAQIDWESQSACFTFLTPKVKLYACACSNVSQVQGCRSGNKLRSFESSFSPRGTTRTCLRFQDMPFLLTTQCVRTLSRAYTIGAKARPSSADKRGKAQPVLHALSSHHVMIAHLVEGVHDRSKGASIIGGHDGEGAAGTAGCECRCNAATPRLWGPKWLSARKGRPSGTKPRTEL